MHRDDIPAGGGYTYIMMSESEVLYVGSTSYLLKRIWEHKDKAIPHSFTAQYNCMKLVYFEVFDELLDARDREYKIKNWSRKKKFRLIESKNLTHLDLAEDWF